MDYLADTVALIRHMEQHPARTTMSATIDDIGELHDRIIAGTAKLLDVPSLTSDQILVSSNPISTIWK